ncbi:hypothetical protein KC331_g6081 [Hortaea werneckii]|nr:hypothetical protein KC331_g6081 [Hortaea werneckii]KAI7716083.1 hypothetical protein KC353_g5644 [Hortaea werneckii]
MAFTNSLQPNHEIEAIYPSLDMIRRLRLSSDQFLLLPPENHQNRYEPNDLIEDVPVIVHAERDGHDVLGVYSMTPAVYLEDPGPVHQAMLDYADDNDNVSQLGFDVHLLSRYAGETVMKLITYRTESGEWLLIERRTRYYDPHGELHSLSRRSYLLTLKQLQTMPCGDIWAQNIKDLIWRRSDPAVQHVRHQLFDHQDDFCPEADEVVDCTYSWKPRRTPPYLNYEPEVSQEALDVTSLSPEDQSCQICGDDFNEADRAPLSLICCRNKICRQCYLDVCKSGRPDEAKCCYCRAEWFTKASSLEMLKFGTRGQQYGRNWSANAAFNDFETFERTCADLDRQSCEDSPFRLKVDAELLTRIWQHIVTGARLEPVSSTPLHLQPVWSPEFAELHRSMPAILTKFDGISMTLAVAQYAMDTECLQAFALQFLRYGNGRPASVVKHALGVPCSVEPKRPGLATFLRRTINRMLNFVEHRRCKLPWCYGWHKHGQKLWYSGPAEGFAQDKSEDEDDGGVRLGVGDNKEAETQDCTDL